MEVNVARIVDEQLLSDNAENRPDFKRSELNEILCQINAP